MLYSEKVMDHFTHGTWVMDADGVGEVGNAKCGDIKVKTSISAVETTSLRT